MAKINLEKISKEQLEQERNPNYKYFDAPELRYKDGRPMRKYNSPKLQAIEMENKNMTAVEWLSEQLIPMMTFHTLEYRNNIMRIIEQAKQMEKEQTEISDEEIYKEAEHKSKIFRGWTEYETSAWVMACQWYREQLKKKI